MSSAPPSAAPALFENEVSLARLYALRALYLLLVVGGGVSFLPQLFRHEPTARGVIPSLLAALWVLSCLGLRYPLKMLPVLLFELVWKTIWLVDYGLPQLRSGVKPATFAEDFKAIVAGPLLVLLVVPWGFVYRRYVKERGARWR